MGDMRPREQEWGTLRSEGTRLRLQGTRGEGPAVPRGPGWARVPPRGRTCQETVEQQKACWKTEFHSVFPERTPGAKLQPCDMECAA